MASFVGSSLFGSSLFGIPPPQIGIPVPSKSVPAPSQSLCIVQCARTEHIAQHAMLAWSFNCAFYFDIASV